MKIVLLTTLIVVTALGIAITDARADDLNTHCYARVVQKLHGPIADLLLPAHSNEAGTILAVSFTNPKSVPLTDIKVHYDFTDAFGTVVDSLDGVWSGSFAPGVEIDYTRKGLLWERELLQADHVKGITCAITGARWADGSVFSEPTQAQPTASNTPPR